MIHSARTLRIRAAAIAWCCPVLAACPQALADSGGPAPLPDTHAPAGVMVDHMHKAGEFMLGYRYSYSRSDGDTLHGTDAASDHDIMHNGCQPAGACSMKQSEMNMHMHMLDIMYAPTDWLTLMLMPMWMSMEMTMSPLEGGHGHGGGHADMGSHSHGTDGIGDTTFGALVRLSEGPGYHVHTGLMFSAPTGSVDEKGPCHGHHGGGHAAPGPCFTHYMMQLGSGTWDFLPSLTYTGRDGLWAWGTQASGVIRLEDENESGYRLGDIFQATAWTSYRLTNWLSASVRVLYTYQDDIYGHYNGAHNHSSPPDLQANYGGRFWDVGLGLNAVVPSGRLQGHRLGIEWLLPIQDDVNGYQQEREGTLFVNWSKSF